jgi:hypothetical protein
MSSKTDITTELRDWAATICSIRGDATPGRKSQMVRDAADEIDRLRARLAQRDVDVAEARRNADELRLLLCEMQSLVAQRTAERDALAAELAALKTQRDEERRDACRSDAYAVHGVYTPEELAKGRGWDCFDAKEARP